MHFHPHFQRALVWYNLVRDWTDWTRKWTHWRSCPTVVIVTVQFFGNWRCIYNGSNEVQNEGTPIKTQTLLKNKGKLAIHMTKHLLPFSVETLQSSPLKHNTHTWCTHKICFSMILPSFKLLPVRLDFNCLFLTFVNINAWFGPTALSITLNPEKFILKWVCCDFPKVKMGTQFGYCNLDAKQ